MRACTNERYQYEHQVIDKYEEGCLLVIVKDTGDEWRRLAMFFVRPDKVAGQSFPPLFVVNGRYKFALGDIDLTQTPREMPRTLHGADMIVEARGTDEWRWITPFIRLAAQYVGRDPGLCATYGRPAWAK